MKPHNFIDLTGQRFAALTVIRFYGYLPGAAAWWCLCDCGMGTVSRSSALRSGRKQSCGCQRGALIAKRLVRHGYARGGQVAREHCIWRGMITRCTNRKRKGYADYGGRGIKVCKRWLSFENFIADMGRCPAGFSIDRKDNDGNYEPGNCIWADKKSQANNRRKRRWHKRPENSGVPA